MGPPFGPPPGRNPPKKNWLRFSGRFPQCGLQATPAPPLEAVPARRCARGGEEHPLKPPTKKRVGWVLTKKKVFVLLRNKKKMVIVSAMHGIPDGAFVGLQNRAKKKYLAADEDGHKVSLRPQPQRGPFSPNAVWRLQRVDVGGAAFVLLQGVAYGRYLAIAPPGPGYGGRRVIQRDYDEANDLGDLMWRPFRVLGVGDLRYVSLRQGQDFNRTLRANGRFRVWNNAVTVDNNEGRWSTMMQWTVRAFRLAPELPPLLPPSILGARREADERRVILQVQANEEGDFDQNFNNWHIFPFYGRSVYNLRTMLMDRLEGLGCITLAVKPGLEGRLTPLVTDLPRNLDTMAIVVFKAGSQGAQNLVYPEIYDAA